MLLANVIASRTRLLNSFPEDYLLRPKVLKLAHASTLALFLCRAQSTITLLEDAAPDFEDNANLRKHLLNLRRLFEDIKDTLLVFLPKHTTSLPNGAGRFALSAESRKTLGEQLDKLDHIGREMLPPMLLQSEGEGNHTEDAVKAMRVSKDSDPALELAKSLLEGKVNYEELIELDESLGSGSFGVVKAGTYYGKPVAIKRAICIMHSPEDRETFRCL